MLRQVVFDDGIVALGGPQEGLSFTLTLHTIPSPVFATHGCGLF